MTCTLTRDVGSLVLDLLEPAEAARLEEHARTCPECSEAVADLRPVVALMDHADRTDPAPDELAFRRFQAAARRRARPRRALAIAAALLLVVGGAVAAVVAHRDAGGTTVSAQSGWVNAQVELRQVASGTQLQLRLRGVQPGLRCQLVAIATDGHREIASTWLASYAGEASVDGGVSLRRSDIARLVVETLDGRALVTMRLA